jgi:hypothetical protein
MGINGPAGIKAGIYKNQDFSSIPSLNDIGTPGSTYYYRSEAINDETFSHMKFLKGRGGSPTGWISTTSSLLRAIQIVFIQHREPGGMVLVIDTKACERGDIFTAPELRDCLPGFASEDDDLRKKSPNEYLIRGKVEKKAIVGWVHGEALRMPALQVLAPGLGNVTSWGEKYAWEQAKSVYNREVNAQLLQAAARLALGFECEVGMCSVLAKMFLSEEFEVEERGVVDMLVSENVRAEREQLEQLKKSEEQMEKENIMKRANELLKVNAQKAELQRVEELRIDDQEKRANDQGAQDQIFDDLRTYIRTTKAQKIEQQRIDAQIIKEQKVQAQKIKAQEAELQLLRKRLQHLELLEKRLGEHEKQELRIKDLAKKTEELIEEGIIKEPKITKSAQELEERLQHLELLEKRLGEHEKQELRIKDLAKKTEELIEEGIIKELKITKSAQGLEERLAMEQQILKVRHRIFSFYPLYVHSGSRDILLCACTPHLSKHPK